MGEHSSQPLIVRHDKSTHRHNAMDAATYATHATRRHKQEHKMKKNKFHKGLQYRLARRNEEKRRETKDPIPPARPTAMEVSSMGVLILRHRQEYEERGQASQYFSDVWKCAMEMERRHAKDIVDRSTRRKRKLKVDRNAQRALRMQLAWQRQADAVNQQFEALDRMKDRRHYLWEISQNRSLSSALFAIRLERAQKQGLQIPPLCSCRHGVSPWNPLYSSYCDKACPVRNNYAEYQRRLLITFEELFKDCSTMDVKYLNLAYRSKRSAFEDRAVVERREQIQQHARDLEKSRFSKAMETVHIEKMQRAGVVIPAICYCNHGVYPLNPVYIKRCHHSCQLYHNPVEYKKRLLVVLEYMLKKAKNGGGGGVLGMLGGRTNAAGISTVADKPITIDVNWKHVPVYEDNLNSSKKRIFRY